jgi:hypothetical protein
MRVKGPGLVISSEVAAPGRIVLAAGRRLAVETVEGTFLAFRAPAGAAGVRVVYRLASYWWSVVLAVLAAVALAAIPRGGGASRIAE